MTKRAIILHGMPSEEEYRDYGHDSPSNAHWLPWLQRELCARGILAQTPELPASYDPNYGQWKVEFERQVVDENTILVGHSCGAGFLVRWLSESNQKVERLVLVAPWLDVERENGDLFDFLIDVELAEKTKKGVDILYSTNDGTSIQATLALLKKKLPNVRYHKFIDHGHFCLGDMGTREFPELLDICLSKGVE